MMPYDEIVLHAEAQAVLDFMHWLTARPERSGPFGASWGPEPGYALVEEYCAKKGWPYPPVTYVQTSEAAPVDTTTE